MFSYLNLNRAFLELEAGAELYCLHKNRWWQTAAGPELDTGAFVAGLEYAADTEATVLGKPSRGLLRGGARGARRRAGYDLDGRRRSRGRLHGRAEARDADDPRAHRQVPSRRGRALTGAARRDRLARSRSCPTGWSATSRCHQGGGRPDRDRANPARARAPRRGFQERCFTEDERAYCDSKPNPPQHYAGRFAAKEAVGKALGSGVYFTWKEIEVRGRPKPGVHLSGARHVGRAGGARARSSSR